MTILAWDVFCVLIYTTMQACCIYKSHTPFIHFFAICGNLYAEVFASGKLEGVAVDRITCRAQWRSVHRAINVHFAVQCSTHFALIVVCSVQFV